MRRRCGVDHDDEPPAKKRSTPARLTPTVDLRNGTVLKDISGNKWTIGQAVGAGGFGEIYLVSDSEGNSNYVAKVEDHQNGPLFVEINCYLRIAKREMITEWKEKKKLQQLGMPHYVASGSHLNKSKRYRFLILPKFDRDLGLILNDKQIINLKTVLIISCQILDVLEYIHEKGYIHSDIKASNILLGGGGKSKNEHKKFQKITRPHRINTVYSSFDIKQRLLKLRPSKQINYCDDSNFDELDVDHLQQDSFNNNQVYLLDYGLAAKYVHSNGEHKEYCEDERRAHAGTVLFCSCDAHKGVQSRRSDLESLGYNMIYWLIGTLPWINDIEDPELVAKRKRKLLTNPLDLLRASFDDYPEFLLDYFTHLKKLKFEDKPDYSYYKKLFKKTLKDYGYEDNTILDFDNLEGLGTKPKKAKNRKNNVENFNINRKIVYQIPRVPLQSNNIPLKPLLRKMKKTNEEMTWSKILLGPELLIKRKSRKTENEKETSINLGDLDIDSLNPTSAMIEVFNKFKERNGYSPIERQEFDNFLPGYTPAMMEVHNAMMERKELESLQINNHKVVRNKSKTGRKKMKKNGQCSTRVSPTRSKFSKTLVVVKKEVPARKVKSVPGRRNYTLRG